MVGIYTQTKCVERLDCEYRLFFDLTLSDYQQRHSCEECNGEETSARLCHITLDRLLKIFRVIESDDELLDALEGNLI